MKTLWTIFVVVFVLKTGEKNYSLRMKATATFQRVVILNCFEGGEDKSHQHLSGVFPPLIIINSMEEEHLKSLKA